MIPLVLSHKPQGLSSCGGGVRGRNQGLSGSPCGAVTQELSLVTLRTSSGQWMTDLLKTQETWSHWVSLPSVTATHLLQASREILRTWPEPYLKAHFLRSDDDTGETTSCSTPAPPDPSHTQEPDHCTLSSQSCPWWSRSQGERKRLPWAKSHATDTAGFGPWQLQRESGNGRHPEAGTQGEREGEARIWLGYRKD